MTDDVSVVQRAVRKILGPLIVSAASVGLAFWLFAYTQHDIDQDARLRFDSQAADAKHIIEKRLRSYVGVTYGLKALFAARGSLSRAEFHRYVESLDLKQNYPGFEVLNYARHIQAREKRHLEEEVRRDTSLDPRGYPEFMIKPPGNRPEHHVLIYLEPMVGNEFAFGLDIGSTDVRAKAINRLRDTGELISSGRLLSVGKDRFVGLAMRLTVYRDGARLNTVDDRRAAFVGTVGAGYDVRNLMTGVLDETTMTSMRYRLYDAGTVGEDRTEKQQLTLLYDSAQKADGVPRDDVAMPSGASHFDAMLPFELAGRTWELHFSAPQSAFVQRADAQLPWLVLAGGLLSSALLFGVLYSFASSRERAVALAGEITRELRESEMSLADAQQLARLGSWALDMNAREMTCSAETLRILGLEPSAAPLPYDAFLSRLHPVDRVAFDAAVALSAGMATTGSLEYRLEHGGSDERWVHFILQPLPDSNGAQLRGTIMDVTERKRAEQTERESAVQIRDLLRRLVSVQEAERRRLAADLHDLVGQNLSVLGIGLETIRGSLPDKTARNSAKTFDDMAQLMKETMGSVRQVMSDLRPPLLDDYGLYKAIEWHARQFELRTGLPVSVHGDTLQPRPAPEVELAMFRIVQEALTNAAKHAAASQARIALTTGAGRVRLVIEDNGRGVLPVHGANDRPHAGWGMAVMRERAEAVGGGMRVECPRKGTRIIVEVAAGDQNHPG
ncbi:MAG: CHASE domain-containing protein [Betaproteobacteria bacterium]|nr:CHASE domain-containing protein [Betaproteobacteria bacterium]